MTEQQPQSITEAELAEALRELNLMAGSASIFYPAIAQAIVSHVKRRREPEYEPGGIYLSPDGFRYMRLAGPPSGCWMELHANGSTAMRGDRRPELPLRKLVPKGSQEAAAVLVAEWRGLGEQDDAVPAWRGGYRAALRKCADELGYALKEGQR